MGVINLPKKIYSTTWAQKPPASSMNGKIIRVSDIGNGATFFVSNGTRWQPLGGSCLVGKSNTAVSVTGTLTETTLGTISVPGGLMSSQGILEIHFLFSHTNSALSKVLRGKYGPSQIQFMNSTVTTTNTSQAKYIVRNMNATNSQAYMPTGFLSTLGTSANAISTAAQDMTQDSNITLTAALADVSLTCTLESLMVMYYEG